MGDEQDEQEKVVVDAEDVREVVRWWGRMSEKDKREMSGPAFNLMRKLEKALGEALEARHRIIKEMRYLNHVRPTLPLPVTYASFFGDAMTADRTPDPAVQVVADAVGGDMWRYHTDAEFHAQVYRVVAALREAGHIKNLRQVEGWRFNLDVHREEADCDADPPCSHLFVEEGEQ